MAASDKPRMRTDPFERPSVGCVILAAGASIRFGRGENKLLAKFGGRPLVQRTIDAACGSQAVSCTLVVGHEAEAIETGVETRRCAILQNPRWPEGIASSIRCALQRRSDDDATIFLVGDEPFVSVGDVDALMTEYSAYPDAIVALSAGRIWGTPMLFGRRDYPALLKLRGDRGAKTYAKTQKRRVRFVAATDPRAFADIDTLADLLKFGRRKVL